MQCFQLSIKPLTAFATPLRGDTLFGQLCWAIRYQDSERKLTELLQDYKQDTPFMVVSDPMPAGHIPRPSLPPHLLGFDTTDIGQRKVQKSKKWLPVDKINEPLSQWNDLLVDAHQIQTEMGLSKGFSMGQTRIHNSINRKTGATAKGDGFAPFSRELAWYNPQATLQIYVLIDESQINKEKVLSAIQTVGSMGYGKEASSGLGKFEVISCETWQWVSNRKANAWLTLSPCAPQGGSWIVDNCYYDTFVRFGRHGDAAVHSGKPFKNPVLMAETAAILTPQENIEKTYCGQGLGGLSKAIEGTVQQGYAPVVPVYHGE